MNLTHYFSIVDVTDIIPISSFAVMSSAAMTMLYTYSGVRAREFAQGIISSGIAESQGGHVFTFLGNDTLFQSGCTNLYAAQEDVKVLVALHFANIVLSELKRNCSSIHGYKVTLHYG